MRINLLVLTLLTLAGGACSPYVSRDALFIGYNHSDDRIVIVVNGVDEATLSPVSSTRFVVTIPVPRPDISGPSADEERVRVSVVVRNLRTNTQTETEFCRAGARVVTHVSYEVSSSGRDDVECRSD